MNAAFSVKRLFWLLFLIISPLLLLACWYAPVTNSFSRVGVIVSGVMTLIGVSVTVWRFRIWRRVLIVVVVGVLLFVFCPWFGRYSHQELRRAYVQELESYIGAPYVWGGEGRFGIDCSGLARRGLIDALLKEGFRQRSPVLVREALWLWWHDSTAKGIGEFYSGIGKTFFYVDEEKVLLNEFDYDRRQPLPRGVMATNDTHIMIYLGNKEWIGADPSEGKVVKFHIPETKSYYFSTPMKLVYWDVLNAKNGMDGYGY